MTRRTAAEKRRGLASQRLLVGVAWLLANGAPSTDAKRREFVRLVRPKGGTR